MPHCTLLQIRTTYISELYENSTETDNTKKRIRVDTIKHSVKQTFHIHLVGSLGLCAFYRIEIKRTSVVYRVPRAKEPLNI